jgi:hypothetical protein
MGSEIELELGKVVWHCSDEEGGPDVGVSLTLDDGAQLWCGDISRKLWEDSGSEIAEIGEDGGSWLVVFGPGDDTTVIGKVEFHSGRALLEHVLAPILRTQSTRIKELEEALRRIEAMRPVTCDMSLAHEMADIATEALEAKDSAARASQLLPTDSGRG